jgi:hypothetical protein
MVMRKYIVATLSLAVAMGPASALDVGLGGQAGGAGVDASVGVGSKGTSVGVGASVGGVGGANAGASVDTSNGSVGASLGGSGNVGSASGGVSVGLGASSGSSVGGRAGSASGNRAGGAGAASGKSAGGAGAAPGSTAKGTAAGTGAAGVGGLGTTIVIGPAAGVRHSIALPPILRPSRTGRDKSVRATVGTPSRSPALLRAIPGTPLAVVRVCRNAIMSVAVPLGAVRVQAASAGPVSRHRGDTLTAPVEVRIDYARQGGVEVRRAMVRCRFDAAGRVIAVL